MDSVNSAGMANFAHQAASANCPATPVRRAFVKSAPFQAHPVPAPRGANSPFLRAPFNKQHLPFQTLAHSLQHSFARAQNSIPSFSAHCALFDRSLLRSFAKVQYSTPLLSCAPALFCKNTGRWVTAQPRLSSNKSWARDLYPLPPGKASINVDVDRRPCYIHTARSLKI
jgi:hypothetical protein